MDNNLSQQEVAAYREQAAAAEQAKWDAIASGVSSVGSILGGVGASGGNCCAPIEQGKEREKQEKVREPGKYFLGIRVGDVYVPPPCNGLV